MIRVLLADDHAVVRLRALLEAQAGIEVVGAGGPMAEVIKNSTRYLSDDDLNAIAVYLKDVPAEIAQTTTKSSTVDQEAWAHGEALYADNCTGCHMRNGEGIAEIFPPLKGSSAVQAKLPDTVIHVVLAGARTAPTSGKPTAFAMPAFAGKLDNREAADLVNYIRNAWDNHSPLTNPNTVSKVRQDVEHGGG
jgi:mono/diheme cytochrome c family protein